MIKGTITPLPHHKELPLLLLILVTTSVCIGYYSAIKDVFHFSNINWAGFLFTIGMFLGVLYSGYRILLIQAEVTQDVQGVKKE